MNELTQICIDLEHYETPDWAVEAILTKEIMKKNVLDPCAGNGILTKISRFKGYNTLAMDIYDWGFPLSLHGDYLALNKQRIASEFKNLEFDVFMNPPFSKACEFVKKSYELGADNIICFQRLAWWESAKRKKFWDEFQPSRVYVCGERADCWRHDIPINKRGKRYNPKTGKELAGTPTAHAWFIFEPGHIGSTQLLRIYKNES